jgi:plastocyanin
MATSAFASPRAAALLLAGLTLAACGGGGAAVTTPPEESRLAALRIDPPAASVAVGATVQLSGVPTDAGGSPLSGLPAPAFTSSNEARATVGPTGMVAGKAAGEVTITATLTAAGVTRTASAAVLVTAPAAPATPGTPAPPAPSTATVSAGDHAFAPSAVTIAAGGTVTWRMTDDEHDVTWTGPTPAGGNIPKTDEGVSVSRTFSTPGTYAYRCARHESKGKTGTVVVTGDGAPPANPPPTTPPPPSGSTATVTTPGTSFSPATVTIARGGTVSWEISGATHNVTFQGAAPTGGSVPDTRAGTTVSRVFSTAGSFPYACTRHSGMNGSVVVQ